MQQIAPQSNVKHSPRQLARIQKYAEGKLAEKKQQLFPPPMLFNKTDTIPEGLTSAMKANIKSK